MSDEFMRLGIALGLGLLVGLQRERTDARLAGFRTFPLVTVLGAVCGLLAEAHGGWVVAGGLAALALIILGGDLASARVAGQSPGLTSEVTMLVMFALGAYLMAGSTAVAITICGAVVVLLHLKPQMHTLAARIGDTDFKAIVQFTLLSLVILPVLPNRAFGPLQVLNPFKIWLLVVLMVGLSLVGYVAYKLVGSRAGAWTTGILGGIISSTATTVNVARENKRSPGTHRVGAFVIMIASGISFLRLGVLIGATAPEFLGVAAPALGILFAVLTGCGWFELRARDGDAAPLPPQSNPTELKTPLIFGVLYAVMLLAVAFANERFGARGLYVAAAISGLTDMDAVTLSVSNLVHTSAISAGEGGRAVVVAALANLVFKAIAVWIMGGRQLLGRVLVGFSIAGIAGAALLYWGTP
jgi:uncharacterized membrane protein (DUF4010 family)